ncbi:MAG: MFS transporter [Deltaproteobacteria bacterium]|nr:MFS transporter [Deltaproteobacteria bacterium]
MKRALPNGSRGEAAKAKIIIISGGHLFHDMYTSFLAPVLPLLIEKFALSYAAAGFLSVLMRLPSLLSPVVGSWADRRSLKYIVIASPALTAIAMCLMGNASSYVGLAALAGIAGVSSTCFHVPAPVLIKAVAGKRPGAAMSLFQVGGELSRTIGPFVVLCAVSWWTLAGLYRLIPLGVGTSLLLHWAFQDLPRAHAPAGSAGDKSRIAEAFYCERSFFAALFGILVCKSFSASVVAAFLPVYLTAQGKSLWLAGSALSLLQAAAIAGVFMAGTLSDKIGCKNILLCLSIVTPVSMLLFIYSSGWALIAALVLLGLTAFSSTPVILSLIQQRCSAFPATANGMYMMISFMLGSLTVLLAGWLSDVFGIVSAFKICAGCSLLGLPFLFLLNRGK